MRTYYAYIRVSTVKQGELGSSLQEQKSAIEAYAARHNLVIGEWFEEMETAAKVGRRMFNRMLADLERGKAAGLIIHKIDRSARNLKDWARLGDLIDQGLQIHFAHEAIDLASRGGRLSADIQAVVAADYIRNHRQEVRKGIYGRLKQGLYPLPAPRGYLDRGKGKPKEIDPIAGPLVRQAFDLYASGTYTLQTLRKEMHQRGLRGRTGKPLGLEALSVLLRNPFYCGLIRINRTGQSFEGIHQSIVPKATFDRVQAVMSGRVFARPQKHIHLFRRMIRCAECGYSLIGETRKGHVYYRCHSTSCRGTTLREPDIDRAVRERLAQLGFRSDEMELFSQEAQALRREDGRLRAEYEAAIKRDLGKCDERLTRLTDAFLDGLLDKETFEVRKTALYGDRRLLRDALEAPYEQPFADRAFEILGRGNMAQSLYEIGLVDEKREIVKSVTSDLQARQKSLQITMLPTFQAILDARKLGNGAPDRVLPRIMRVLEVQQESSAP
jgi:DNA invertase Pin-like site-specific DNA recombinase